MLRKNTKLICVIEEFFSRKTSRTAPLAKHVDVMVYMVERTKRIIERLRNVSNDTVCTLKLMKIAGYVVSLGKQKINTIFLSKHNTQQASLNNN